MNNIETYQIWQHPSNLVKLAVTALLCFAVFLWYRRFLRIGTGVVLLLMIVSALLGLTLTNFSPFMHGHLTALGLQNDLLITERFLSPFLVAGGRSELLSPITFRWLFVVFTVPFLAKLYLKWVRGRLTEPEKEVGSKAIQAWLSGGNLVCVLMIAFCGRMMGIGYSFIGLLRNWVGTFRGCA